VDKLSNVAGAPQVWGNRTDHYPDRSLPSILTEPINNKDAEKSERVVKAMMQMVKIDIEALKRAYADK
jgi:hypothetical protein